MHQDINARNLQAEIQSSKTNSALSDMANGGNFKNDARTVTGLSESAPGVPSAPSGESAAVGALGTAGDAKVAAEQTKQFSDPLFQKQHPTATAEHELFKDHAGSKEVQGALNSAIADEDEQRKTAAAAFAKEGHVRQEASKQNSEQLRGDFLQRIHDAALGKN